MRCCWSSAQGFSSCGVKARLFGLAKELRVKLARFLAVGLDIAAVAAIGYAAVAIACTMRFERRTKPRDAETDLPGVTLLVPLRGDEAGLEESLHAFAMQDYPVFQLVLGVARSDDSALAVAERVAAALPERNIEIDVGEARDARNPKIANVLSMMRLARHEVLILADSDTRVDAAYVRTVTAPLRDPSVGVVTCLFAGVHDGTLPSKLGAMFMNEQFIPSVLVNELIRPPQHCLGPTNAFRARVLAEIGGFEALAPHLADDFVLGNLIARRGLRVVISSYVVRTIVSDSSLSVLWEHELRWHRTIRSVQRAGYTGMFLTYPLSLALLALILRPNLRRVATFLAAVIVRMELQRISARTLGVSPAQPWLMIPRDLFGLAVWAFGLGGKSVRWRKAPLQVESGGLLGERLDMESIKPDELRARESTLKILDIRKTRDGQQIPGSICTEGEALERGADLPFGKDDDVVLYCASGNSCSRIAKTLRGRGYRAAALEGGYKGWVEAGYPTEERGC
jgi:ceramide glucosyltransferase